MPKAKATLDALTAQALAGFTPQEIAQLTHYVDRLNANIDRMGDDGATPP